MKPLFKAPRIRIQVAGQDIESISSHGSFAKLFANAVPSSGGFDSIEPFEFQASGSSGSVVTVVKSAEDLEAALDNGAEHIEIQEHLDLTFWGWQNLTDYRTVLEIPEFVKSLRVRRTRAIVGETCLHSTAW